MNFGFGVGDFLAVIKLSKKIWDGCRDSTDQYRDIGKDVRQTNIIAVAIQKYWKNERDNGHPLSEADQNNLREMEDNCLDILNRIVAKLEKHRKLGTRGGVYDRLKWFANDMGPLRNALQNSNYQVAYFNATLTATYASNRSKDQIKLLKELRDQGKILDVVMKQYKQMQEGNPNGKPPPAYSQMTMKDFEEDEAETWKSISADLKETGLSDFDLKPHKALISDWIDTVNSNSTDGPPRHLDPLNESAEEIINRDGTQNGASDSEGSQTIPNRKIPNDPLVAAAPPFIQRPISASTQRSQSSGWLHPSQDGTAFAVRMIAKVLKSKYGEDNDNLYILPIKRAYHYLDYPNAGYLSREEVQQVCKESAEVAGVIFTETDIMSLVRSMDKNRDHQIDREELVEIVMKLRSRILEVISTNSQIAARVDSGLVLKAAFETGTDDYIIPFGWGAAINRFHLTSDSKREFTHEVLRPAQTVGPLQRNIATATYMATKFCATQIANARNFWRITILSMTQSDSFEYNSALDGVQKAVAKFHLFDADGESAGWALDSCVEQMRLIPLELFEDLKDGPIKELTTVQKKCWRLLDPILGFVWDLKFPSHKIWVPSSPDQVHLDVSRSPPDLAEWRRLRMLERSRLIDKAAAEWVEMTLTVAKCQEWYNENKSNLFREVNEAVDQAKSLHDAQEQANNETSERMLTIENVRLENLPREGLRSRYPEIYFRVLGDGYEYDYDSGARENSSDPEWSFHKRCKAKRDGTVQLDFHRGNSREYGFTKASKTLIGTYKFRVRDVTNFESKTLKVTTTGIVDMASKFGFSRESKLKTKVFVDVSSQWEPNATWETSHGGLPTVILKRPIPSDWEVRRTKEEDVYFFSKTEKKPTACLWRDPTPSGKRPPLLEPLPPGWRLAQHSSKLLYHRIGGTGYQVERPEIDNESNFEHVLESKSYCQLGDFFSEQFVKVFEAQGKRELRLPRAVRTAF